MAYSSYNARKRGTRQQRVCFRMEVLQYCKNHSLRETAKYFRVSKSFVCKWQARCRERNDDIYDHSSRPKHCARAYSESDKRILTQSLTIDNFPGRKRNILVPTWYRARRILWNRSYESIQHIAQKLLGKCQVRRKTTRTRKIRTGAVNSIVCHPGEIVQIDVKYVPTCCIMQTEPDDRLRRKAILRAERKKLRETLFELDRQKALFPTVEAIDVIRRETIAEYEWFERNIWTIQLPPLPELKIYQYTAVDMYSRWAFRWLFTEHSEAASLRFIIELRKRAPFHIQQIQTDNGSEFASEYLKGHESHQTAFQRYLDIQQIGHLRIRKGRPWENGYAEAQHRIDQERLYNRLRVSSFLECIHAMIAYQRVSNAYPKRCLGMQCPNEILQTN